MDDHTPHLGSHSPGREVVGYLAEVGENYRCLLSGPASDQAAYEDH